MAIEMCEIKTQKFGEGFFAKSLDYVVNHSDAFPFETRRS